MTSLKTNSAKDNDKKTYPFQISSFFKVEYFFLTLLDAVSEFCGSQGKGVDVQSARPWFRATKTNFLQYFHQTLEEIYLKFKRWNSKKMALDPKWRALAQIWGQMSDSSHQGRTVLFSDFFKSWNICLNRQKEMASGAMFSPFFLYQGSVFFVKKVKLCIIHHLCSWSKV